MKMNLAVFKKGKPVYWIIGGIVVFVLFYMMFNRGASSGGGGITTVQSGPSDAAVAASTQLTLAQTQANAGVAMAQLQYNGQIAQTQAAADVAKYTATLDAQTSAAAFATQKALAGINAEYSLETARLSGETQLGLATISAGVANNQITANVKQWEINADVLSQQLKANADMFSAQMKAATYQSLAQQIGTVKPNDRDNAFALLTGAISGGSLSYQDRGSGSFQIAAPK